ncbi:MAG: nuclear transport factor 2 family protein [Gammaproteobacteria bacterium]|nr:nuclear transport factor 2 family protein [Gammaproteobacteria bacterium]MYD76202.1 nuclear transport factor 2 family protein [Gammaproteobacteria bacterium]MYJ52625.1 nuclear transport factor 2 family protein [Gammaproteobacteria bacterium]
MQTETKNRASGTAALSLAEDLWRLFDAGRFRDALPLLSEDFEAHWPNTRERIRNREDFIALNENYPGSWRCTIRRIEKCAEGVVTVTEISDGKTGLFAVSFFTVRAGRITAAEEYFSENGPPPFDRSAWTERY